MTKTLLAVQGPMQFIAGYIAMSWYQKQSGQPDDEEAILLMYDFLMPPHLEKDFADTILQLSAFRRWGKIVYIDSIQMRTISNARYSRSMAGLKRLIGASTFDEIYLARDYCGFGSPLIINCYAEATKITYGDSLGLVGNEQVFNPFDWMSPFHSVLSLAKQFTRKILLGGPSKFPFDKAVLTTPMDWSGHYLQNIRLHVPTREHAVETINTIYTNMPHFREYCRQLEHCLIGHPGFVFLLSNLSGSSLMSAKAEIELYTEIIKNTTPAHGVVFIKGHPRNGNYILDEVANRLKGLYSVVIIDNEKFSRIPIELWVDLMQACTIIPIFSTSAINLQYFFGKNVILPLNNSLIDYYFYPNKADYMKKANQLILDCIKKLDRWDGQSILWRGTND